MEGSDLDKTIHGLFAQELRGLAPPHIRRSALTDRKGRLVGLFRIHAWRPGEALLEGGPGQAEATLAHLATYLPFTDTTASALAGTVAITPGAAGPDEGSWEGEEWVARLAAPECATLAIRPGSPAPTTAPDPALWDAWRVAQGIPALGSDLTLGKSLPAEAGLEHTHISFSKGCFPGQEVVLRLRTQGSVRQRLVNATGEAASGDPLSNATGEVGAVTTWAAGRGFAMVRAEALAEGASLTSPQGAVTLGSPLGDPSATI